MCIITQSYAHKSVELWITLCINPILSEKTYIRRLKFVEIVTKIGKMWITGK